MNERRIEYQPLSKLKPAKRNPKLHSQDIGTSMERFGYAEPILLDERTGRLVAGHGRLEFLQKKKLAGEHPPGGVEVKGKDWLVPVVRGWSSKNDKEAGAYLVASNQITIAGGWSQEALSSMLSKIPKQGLGFQPEELDALLGRMSEAAGALARTSDDTGRTPTQAKENYDTTSLRQVVLVFQADRYEEILDMLAAVREKEQVDNNAEAVERLLRRATDRAAEPA